VFGVFYGGKSLLKLFAKRLRRLRNGRGKRAEIGKMLIIWPLRSVEEKGIEKFSRFQGSNSVRTGT